jgi:hypothetical protein
MTWSAAGSRWSSAEPPGQMVRMTRVEAVLPADDEDDLPF